MNNAIKNWRTTVGGIISGGSAIFFGAALIQQGDYVKAIPAIVGGLGLIYKGWHGVDVQNVPQAQAAK